MIRRSPVVSSDWLSRASLLGAAVLVLMGTLVLVGWVQGIDALVQIQPEYAPMQPNTALCLVVIGIVLGGLNVFLSGRGIGGDPPPLQPR